MEICDPIHGFMHFDSSESAIIDTPIYQRLRHIKQLGFSEYGFPSAMHNRYIHSLGVCHLSHQAFEQIFDDKKIAISPNKKKDFKKIVRLAALLHDIGHGPLSHSIEIAMPKLKELNVSVYKNEDPNRQATHEDYTIQIIINSPISDIIKKQFDISPYHVAQLISYKVEDKDSFFVENDINYKTLLKQIISSDLDIDRMDYLERDAYFSGTTYGRSDFKWILNNLDHHIETDIKTKETKAYLAVQKEAIYTIEDFLLGRHQMLFLVYFHHKSTIYDEMLKRYLRSKECQFQLSPNIEQYCQFTDHSLYEYLEKDKSKIEWADRIASRKPYSRIYETLSFKKERTKYKKHFHDIQNKLKIANIDCIIQNSEEHINRSLSYQNKTDVFIKNKHQEKKRLTLKESLSLFKNQDSLRYIDRIYTKPEQEKESKKIIANLNI